MKKITTFILTALMLLCVSFSFVGCIGDETDNENDTKKLSVSNENISINHTEYLGYTVKVTGTITNTTGNNLSYISVEYKIYDSSNAVIGTALANANSISKGETWRFEANSLGWFEQRPAKVTFSEIQTMKEF